MWQGVFFKLQRNYYFEKQKNQYFLNFEQYFFIPFLELDKNAITSSLM
jgi:hypothetical protein